MKELFNCSDSFGHIDNPPKKKLILGSNTIDNGGVEWITSEHLYPHEIVQFLSETPAQNNSFLAKKYLNEHLSAPDIAKKIGVSKAFILDQLKKFNIKRRAPGAEQLHAKIPSINVPYGKKLKNGRLVNLPKEQKVIETMQHLRSKGHTYTDIVRYLNEKNIPTKQGGKWHHYTVSTILKRGGIS